MGNFSSGISIVNPSTILPGIIMQYSQPTGAFKLLPGEAPDVRLSSVDLVAYQKYLRVRTRTQSGQSMWSQLPSVSVVPNYDQMKTYRIATRTDYQMFDEEGARQWGYSLPEALRLGARQGVAQTMRNYLLYGYDASNYEGVTNAPNAYRPILPPDSNGNSNYSMYDNGEFAQYLLGLMAATKTRTYQLGMPLRFVFLGPQRFLTKLMYSGIIQLTSYQREGAGSDVIAGMIKSVAERVGGDEIIFAADDTLIGKGQGGTDLIVMSIPEIRVPQSDVEINTNIFATLTPNQQAMTTMLCDMPAPLEVVSPMQDGGTTTVYTLRVTPGWNLRSEGLTLLSAAY